MTKSSKSRSPRPSNNKTKKKEVPASVVWFEIPVDDPERAQEFYRELFGWKINAFPQMKDYWHVDTGGADASPDGGMLPRMHPEHTITNYIMVSSVTEYMDRVEELGGTICKPKTAVPGMGQFAIVQDTENNTFALWEVDPKAK